jgi:hypothetical protein
MPVGGRGPSPSHYRNSLANKLLRSLNPYYLVPEYCLEEAEEY